MDGPDLLSCQMEERGDALHLTLVGHLDYQTRDSFEIAVRAALTAYPRTVVLDMSAVPFVSSEGASALIDADRRAREDGCTLIIRPSPFMRRRLDTYGLTGVLTLTPATTEQAEGPDRSTPPLARPEA